MNLYATNWPQLCINAIFAIYINIRCVENFTSVDSTQNDNFTMTRTYRALQGGYCDCGAAFDAAQPRSSSWRDTVHIRGVPSAEPKHHRD